MRANLDDMAPVMTEEMGKPIKEGRAEVEKSAWCAEHYAENAKDYLANLTLPSDATHSYVQHLPLGVVMGILPWNAPFWLAFRFASPSLMAGTPLTSRCTTPSDARFMSVKLARSVIRSRSKITTSASHPICRRAFRRICGAQPSITRAGWMVHLASASISGNGFPVVCSFGPPAVTATRKTPGWEVWKGEVNGHGVIAVKGECGYGIPKDDINGVRWLFSKPWNEWRQNKIWRGNRPPSPRD